MRMKRLQIKAENVTDQGIFTGHASVFGVVDLDNDVVEPGAFAESIATGTAAAGFLLGAPGLLPVIKSWALQDAAETKDRWHSESALALSNAE